MNTIDRITAALTPGSPFNRNDLIFRSVATLAQFAGVSEEEVVEILNGDLVQLVTCKPSAKGKGILVALTANIPEPAEEAGQPMQIFGGNAVAAANPEGGVALPLNDAAPGQPAEAPEAANAEPPQGDEEKLLNDEDMPF